MFHCYNSFKIFGNGGDKLMLVTKNKDGKEVVYMIDSPIVSSISINSLSEEYELFGRRFAKPVGMSSTINIDGGDVKYIVGDDLSDIYNPTDDKSIMDLLREVNKKFESRG